MGDAPTPTIAIVSALSLVAGPLLCISAVRFVVARRSESRLLLLGVIPLALTSISIQLVAATMSIVAGFRAIGEQQSTGIKFVTSVFASASSALLWRFVEVGVCVAVATILAQWVGNRRQDKEEGGSLLYSATAIAVSAAALVAVVALVWFYHDVVELSMVIADPRRAPEATAQLGNLGLSGIAAMLGRRLIMLAWGGLGMTLCLIGIGVYCLRAEERRGFLGSIVVAVLALAWCATSISVERSAQVYLQEVGSNSGSGHAIYHAYSRSLI